MLSTMREVPSISKLTESVIWNVTHKHRCGGALMEMHCTFICMVMSSILDGFKFRIFLGTY
jgi:hypothetical protein